jgi:hypothetical protein
VNWLFAQADIASAETTSRMREKNFIIILRRTQNLFFGRA